jgi:hypothetical protein
MGNWRQTKSGEIKRNLPPNEALRLYRNRFQSLRLSHPPGFTEQACLFSSIQEANSYPQGGLH